MKTYKKVKLETKNAPTGSYAAGCQVKDRNGRSCQSCDLGR